MQTKPKKPLGRPKSANPQKAHELLMLPESWAKLTEYAAQHGTSRGRIVEALLVAAEMTPDLLLLGGPLKPSLWAKHPSLVKRGQL